MINLTGHFFLFGFLAFAALFGPLLLGKFIRPRLHTPEKDAIYECGEPTIGSSYIQFDLRFYVVALLFIIFDVEVAFFFPWAMGFGNATQLADTRLSEPARTEISQKLLNVPPGQLPAEQIIPPETAMKLGYASLVDILVFFGVLLVGFAYVWKRGDLDWVRAFSKPSRQAQPSPAIRPPMPQPTEQAKQPVA